MHAMTMRPPPVKTSVMSASAAPQQQQQQQQHYHHHLRHQQPQPPPQQNEGNCKQQLQFTSIQTKAYVELPPLQSQTLQQKIPHKNREIFTENHYNFADSAATKPSTSFQYHYNNDADDHAEDSIRLLDLSTSPPTHDDTIIGVYPRPVIVPVVAGKSLKRSSVLSTSSSEDEPPSNRTDRNSSSSSTAALYDDAAESFIIRYPADTPRFDAAAADNLPLCETVPLLTNIEATVSDKQRSICLNKTGASLIFTRKDLTAIAAPVRYVVPTPPNNNCAAAVHEPSRSSGGGAPVLRRSYHQSLRSGRKQTKHLPASYLQDQCDKPNLQQRRSLQLNYNNNNNNLVPTSASVTAVVAAQNNNNCCGVNAKKPPPHPQKSQLHTAVTPPPNSTTTITTAAVSRKQHAYSWYAPVYSALEEELEQDSRDSSPIHNLANTKKHHHSNHYQERRTSTATSRHLLDPAETLGNTAAADNETVALLETRKHIHIQGPLTVGGAGKSERDRERILHVRRPNSVSGGGQLGVQVPTSLPLHNGLGSGGGGGVGATIGSGDAQNGDFSSIGGQHADVVDGSLGLTGSQLPPRRRLGNFLKSLVGRKRNSATGGVINATAPPTATGAAIPTAVPSSPEITITRTPSDQNMGVLGDPAARFADFAGSQNGDGKLTNGYRSGGSTSSLNVVHQKLRNIMRREGSAASLHHEKSQSIVQYSSGMRKCETVLALTRQTQSLCSPMYGLPPTTLTDSCGGGGVGGGAYLTTSTGSGIFNANGVEQIRPLNRLRNSVTSMNATCSRCSSILSLAASGSRYSLNIATGAYALNTAHSQRQLSTNRSCSVLSTNRGGCSRSSSADEQQQQSDQIDGSDITTTTTTSSTCISPPSLNATTVQLTPTPTTTSPSPNSTPTATAMPTLTPTVTHSNCALTVPPPVAGLLAAPTPAATERPQSDAALEAAKPFEMFTCKLCLIDVESASEATTLQQCGCQFCTECMRAYVEFEICEAAYEISCPDAQCPSQGIITPAEIANLTTANLMKKHHRYRLNREIDLDKTRTWCPRAGCETVCHVGPPIDLAGPSTSATTAVLLQQQQQPISPSTDGITAPLLCAVQCPSCKDVFCSACKKTWHANMTCEENGRRLAADGQDDIGIPFDNDLIKCCPMCAVPIEKDEGCAQMMCKRCKHVFCWYCLASLDDDFLLRHYDKGPCKNKLGHSRASVVWHRAQVIGIFAGFGILLLVASPLLLLAAPCIICCKCRSCSGSKIDDVDGELDEAAALQS